MTMIRESSYLAALDRVCQDVVAPAAVRVDREDVFPRDVFDALRAAGSVAPSVPEQYGGGGETLPTCVRAGATLARASASVALSWGAHAFLCAHNLCMLGTEAQRRRYLPDLASGRTWGGFAITEPGSGSDATSIATRAERDGESYRLTGTKTFITNAQVGDVFLVFARAEAGVSLFIVERSFPGFGNGKSLHKLGFRGSPTGELILDGCRVPRENLVGVEGEGARLMMRCLDVERTLLSGIQIGMMEALQEELVNAAGETPSQALCALLAEVVAARYIVEMLGQDAAQRLQEGERVTRPASVTKLYGAEAITHATNTAMMLLGLPAARSGTRLERLLRDARLISIGAGTSEVQKLILSRDILKERQGR
ncbi:MAG: acyl-CoA dehydrogenase family protein [Candidatus Xenobia bacterium]